MSFCVFNKNRKCAALGQVFLSVHQKCHTGFLFRCNEYDNTSSQGSNLKTHKRQHSGEKLYICNICMFSSPSSSTLSSHERNTFWKSIDRLTLIQPQQYEPIWNNKVTPREGGWHISSIVLQVPTWEVKLLKNFSVGLCLFGYNSNPSINCSKTYSWFYMNIASFESPEVMSKESELQNSVIPSSKADCPIFTLLSIVVVVSWRHH